MRTDGELNRHMDQSKREKEEANIYDVFTDRMVTKTEWLDMQAKRSEQWKKMFNATP